MGPAPVATANVRPAPAAHASAGGRPARFPPTVIRETPLSLAGMLPAGHAAAALAGGAVRTARAFRTTTRTVCAPIDFTEVGVSWHQRGRPANPLAANVSVSSARGAPAAPTRLSDEGFGGGPDPGSREDRRVLHATQPLWTGTGRCVALSLDLPAGVTVSQVRVAFLNTLGTAFGGPQVLTPLPMPGSGVTPALQSSAVRPAIISRTSWGADPKLINCFFGYAPELKMAFVHHTDSPNDYSPGQSAAIVRGIYAYHTNVHHWCDIGYNFLVDRYGRIFEGRQGGEDQPVIPAAVMGFNTDSVSIAAIGTFTTATPPPVMLSAIEHLLAWRLSLANRSAAGTALMQSGGGEGNRYKKGVWVHFHLISGHRDANFTSCPGNRLYADLPAIRSAVAGLTHHTDPGTIVYAADVGGTSQVFVEDADGTGLRRLTNLPDGASDPALSPGGSKVAFVEGTGENANIEVEPVAGGPLQPVAAAPGFDGQPAWSPDGSRIAFTSDRSGNDDIWVDTLGTGGLQQITSSPATDEDPTWNPRGGEIAFASNRADNFDIWTVKLGTGAVEQRTHNPADDTQPAWSPDGTELAFTSNRSGNNDIWTLDLESEKTRQLTTDPGDDQAPSWSAGGGRIAFQSDRSGQDEIYLANINTTTVAQFTTTGGESPGWKR